MKEKYENSQERVKCFRNIEHFKSIIKTIPISFLPDDGRMLQFDDGNVIVYSPWNVETKTLDDGTVQVERIVNQVNGKVKE